MNSAKELLAEFETLSTSEWMQKIEKFLKGRPFSEIVLQLEDDVEIKPFYRKEDTTAVVLPALNSNNWLISESFHFDGKNAEALNKLILKSLEGGVESVSVCIEDGSPKALSNIFKGVYLQMIDIHLCGTAFEKAPTEWLNEIEALPEAKAGKGSFDSGVDLSKSISVLQNISGSLPNYTAIHLRIKIGKSVISDLALLLKHIASAFDALIAAGLTADKAQEQFRVTFTVSDDYLLSIAALRAFKRLWLAILEAYNVEKAKWPKIHAVSSQSEASEEPYWNMISNTTQALSAAIAGVYSIEVIPTDTSGASAEFSRRIARNVQQLLKLESHIDHIIDPSAGSYYIENYTTAIAAKSWEQFLAKVPSN
jgi:methylmalonyl-CoA mutase